MRNAEVNGEIERLLEEGNHLAACLRLRESDIESAVRQEMTGRIASRVVDDLSQTRDRERVTYLRSLLVWLLRDVPGLSSVYADQLRLAGGAARGGDVMSGLRTLSDIANLVRGNREGSEDVSDAVRQRVEDVKETVRSGEVQDRISDFVAQAGQGVEEGLRRAAEFLESFTRPADDKPPPGSSGSTPKDESGDTSP